MPYTKPAVVYIITKLELGGAQKVCLALFNNLAASTDTYLITGTQGPLVEQVQNNPRAFLIPELTREVNFGLKSLVQECKAFCSLVRILKKINRTHPHLQVHTHSTKAGYMGRWAAWVAGIPTRIHTVHGFGFNNYQPTFIHTIAYVLEYLTAFITSSYICVSTHDQQVGVQKLPGFAKKNILIRASVDDQQFSAARALKKHPQQLFVFGTIACFKPQKNCIDLLKAFTAVHAQHPSTRLELIGDGIMRPVLEKWITDHQLQDVVTLHGWQHNVVPFMSRWHCFALSSLWEGLPCSIVEALFMEIPVVAYNVGGISDVLPTNCLVEAGDWQTLAKKMEQLVLLPTFYAPITNLDAFTMQTMLTDHQRLYAQSSIQ